MYSRNRSFSPEENYRNNLPPIYSGSRFRYGRQEDGPGVPVNDARGADRQSGGGRRTHVSGEPQTNLPVVPSPRTEREEQMPETPREAIPVPGQKKNKAGIRQ